MLYKQYNEVLYSYGKRFTGDTHLVEDAVQETFISIWKYRHNLAAGSNPTYYLLRSFRNTLLQLLQTRSGTTYTEESLDFSFEVAFDSKLIAGEEAAILSRRVQQALAQLTGRQREIIYFRFFEGLSFEEIAGIMQMQVRATYKLSARALAALRGIMASGTGSLLLLVLIPHWA